ncbi:MAG: AAA family ATPase [Actinomycetota bacterium]|nr:AAA family ATPase [Actinomycetota bacterium]
MLFAYLVTHRDRPVSRDEIIDVLWPRSPPRSPDGAVSTLLTRLRHAVGRDTLAGRTQLALRLPADAWIDVEACRAAAAEAESRLDEGDAAGALAIARTALEIVARPFLPEFDGQWVEEDRRELEELHCELLASRARAGVQLGGAELAEAERAARSLIEHAPYRESGYAILMEAHARRGDVAEALRVYDRLRALLIDELGVPPAQSVTALHERLLHAGDAPPTDAREESGAPPRSRATRGRAADAIPPAADAAAEPLPLPAIIARAVRKALVGRGGELELLRDRWREVESGERRFSVMAGEPGIGKTFVAARFAAVVHEAGGTVLYGRCDEDTIVPYQPFVEALRPYVAHEGPARLADSLGAQLDELVPLLPELAKEAPEPDDRLQEALETRRYRLFEAVVALLIEASRARPLLLALEDLHWADAATLLMLRHALRRTDGARILILATYRDTELAASHPLARLLADARREHSLDRLSLAGLDEEETAALVSARAVADATAEFARRLREQTGGNPFFVEEMLRNVVASAGEGDAERLGEDHLERMGVPEGVEETINRRLGRLSERTGEILAAAAALGRDFRIDALEAFLDERGDRAIDALEEAVADGVIVEYPDDAQRFSFCHALLRETIYGGLTRSRRARLHLGIGEALEARREQLGVTPAELAHHFFLARHLGVARKAVAYAVEAGDRAIGARAYERAVEHYERALEVLDQSTPADDETRCEIALTLGTVRWQASQPGAREAFEHGAALARRLGSSQALARAALGAGGRFYAPGGVDEGYIQLLEEALHELPDEDAPVRAKLLARLAEKLVFADPGDRSLDLSFEAIEMAMRVGDRDALAAALRARHAALLHVDHLDERLRVSRDLVQLVERLGRRELAALAHHWLLYDLFELGDIEAARRAHAELGALADELRQPLYRHSLLAWRGVLEQLAGRFDAAERMAHEARSLAKRAGDAEAGGYFTAQLFAIRREQGRLGELRPAIERLARPGQWAFLWRAALPLVYLEADESDAAIAALEPFPAGDLAGIPRDMFWLRIVASLSEASAAVGDAERADLLHRLLSPHADRVVQAGFSGCFGSVGRFVGLLATSLERWDEAARHFEAALEQHVEMGSPPLVARTQCDYAETILTRGERRERTKARELLARSHGTATELGMAGVARRAQELLDGMAARTRALASPTLR